MKDKESWIVDKAEDIAWNQYHTPFDKLHPDVKSEVFRTAEEQYAEDLQSYHEMLLDARIDSMAESALSLESE
jgi:hypothetical protein